MKAHHNWLSLAFLALLFQIQQISCQGQTTQNVNNATIQSGNLELYEGLVLGVGQGTIVVCIFGIIGLIICFFKDCSPTPSLMVALAILLPVITLLIIIAIPKKSLSTDTEKEDLLPTDAFRIRTGIFSALLFLVCVLVSFLMCIGKMTTLTGTRMDSDQTEIQNARRMKNLQQQVRNEAERLSEQGAAPENEAVIGEDPGLSPVKRDFDEENLGNMNEEQPFDPGYDFENQNNMYENDNNPLRNDYGQF